MEARFRTRKQRQIAALLRVRPMSLSEVLDVVGGDKTTLKRGLESLRDQELLDYVGSDAGPVGPGRPAGLWSLTEKGVSQAEADTADEPEDPEEAHPKRGFRESQRCVFASLADASPADIATVLADGDLTSACTWITRIDGDGPHYVFAFDNAVGEQPPENLAAALRAIGMDCRGGTVRSVREPASFIDSIRTAQKAATRANARRSARARNH
jgi:hypothetical protein